MQIEHVHDGKFSSTRDKEQTARIFQFIDNIKCAELYLSSYYTVTINSNVLFNNDLAYNNKIKTVGMCIAIDALINNLFVE